MSYIDEDYYLNTFKGEASNEDLSLIISRASDMVDILTMYKIKDINSVDAFTKNQIQKATAAQTEFIIKNGGLANLDVNGGSESVTVGKFSYSKNSSTSSSKDQISSFTLEYLFPTGLLYRGL